jgi:hypothetical protein
MVRLWTTSLFNKADVNPIIFLIFRHRSDLTTIELKDCVKDDRRRSEEMASREMATTKGTRCGRFQVWGSGCRIKICLTFNSSIRYFSNYDFTLRIEIYGPACYRRFLER